MSHAAEHTAEAATVPFPAFDFQPRTRVVFGPGKLSSLGQLVQELGASRVLLVTDPGIRRAGHADKGADLIRAAGLNCIVFDNVQPNPSTDDIALGLEVARAGQIDLLVGLGGGSSMDCAKGINFLFTNGGRMEDYWGVGKATKPMLPMIAVPTTAGTGSEAQSFALISQVGSHRKMACGDPKAACRIAVLDPELTISQPAFVTAVTGIDAISHAIEAHVTIKRNPVSQLFSRQAWQMLATGFPIVLRQPHNLAARSSMLLGAHLAGAAIENSMLGATHALANPLTARFEITHGQAIGLMLPHVIRYNGAVVGALYEQLEKDIGLPPDNGRQLAQTVEDMVRTAGLPLRLRDVQVPESDLASLAADASQQWTASFNPRPVAASQLEELYRCAW